MIDPFGFPFESFDALGRPRTEEQGRPIDTSADLPLDGETIAIEGYRDLVERLGQSQSAFDCFASHVQLFVDGTKRSTTCLPATKERPIRDVLVEWISSEDFVTRGAQ